MSETTRLTLPYLAEAQAQKHVTINEALRRLDAVVHLSAKSASTDNEPSAPVDGDAYILTASAMGTNWTGQPAGTIAARQDGAWVFIAPVAGMAAFIEDESALRAYSGAAWIHLSEFGSLGINTSADTTNKLAVKSDAVLFSHDDVTPGNGDVRFVINKSASGGTASFVFQTAFSGKAEFGLTGSDNFTIKVADDGGTFRDAIVIDRQTGTVSFPNTP
ncbi:MAG: DUF2793 domain-containing protein [Pseudomonadota bacterium]